MIENWRAKHLPYQMTPVTKEKNRHCDSREHDNVSLQLVLPTKVISTRIGIELQQQMSDNLIQVHDPEWA